MQWSLDNKEREIERGRERGYINASKEEDAQNKQQKLDKKEREIEREGEKEDTLTTARRKMHKTNGERKSCLRVVGHNIIKSLQNTITLASKPISHAKKDGCFH